MKTLTLPFRKSATFFAVHLALVIGIVMFTFSIGNSQSVTTNNQSTVVDKMGAHAPDLNDKDIANKKQEWRTNYPEEYKSYMNKVHGVGWDVTVTPTTPTTPATTSVTRKMSEHAPEVNDPDYITKFAEFMKNYPEEYKAGMNINSGTTVPVNNK